MTSTSTPTETSADGDARSSHPSLDRARFIPGTVLAKRYRIVGLLGRGGMGEVYRAEDLKLGQQVALKFLPEEVGRDEGRLERLLNEVRVALRVTHPNVCRVHDVGEVDGHHYLSMEYVDGEDLASLLRRIGRLPRDKATQIARQLCAGLAAAHEQGILHRDLKPANVMIDGRGRAKITDFGLARLAGAVRGEDVRAGTPLYMAPEQLAGKEVTARSDLYSLGLVLYELFTGKRAFEASSAAEMLRLEQESTPESPSSHVDGLDPSVERAILRCLEREPRERPASALSVAAALPGGDPLAAALAAGETPSPEMVAAAGPRGGLRPGIAAACLALVLAGLGCMLWAPYHVNDVVLLLPFDRSYEALKDDASEMAADLVGAEPPADGEAWFFLDPLALLHFLRERDAEGVREALSLPGQGVLSLLYRQSPRSLVPDGIGGNISYHDPRPIPGDVAITLDLKGDLVRLRAVPPFVEWSDEPAEPAAWTALFEAAGLDITEFEPTAPRLQPQVYADERRAWTGVLPDRDGWPVRIEAAAFRGTPVFFEKVVPTDAHWAPGGEDEREEVVAAFFPLAILAFSVLGLVVLGTVLLALRNLRLGRGDRKGAGRLAALVAILQIGYRVLNDHHVADFFGEVYVLTVALSGAVTLGFVFGVVYLALEPYVRKLWPETLVSWTRMVSGRLRDPLVGRDVLVGLAFTGGVVVIEELIGWILLGLGIEVVVPAVSLDALRGGRHVPAALLSTAVGLLMLALIVLMLLLIFRIVLRRTWIAALAFCLAWMSWMTLQFSIWSPSPWGGVAGAVTGLLASVLMMTLLIRFGLLAFLAGSSFGLMGSFPITSDVSAPYFTIGLVPVVTTLVLAMWGFRTALAGQPLFRDELLGVQAPAKR